MDQYTVRKIIFSLFHRDVMVDIIKIQINTGFIESSEK